MPTSTKSKGLLNLIGPPTSITADKSSARSMAIPTFLTPTKPDTVRVSASTGEGCLAIRIADSGVGMDPELLDSVVRPFHRLRSALDGQHQGAGLGLPFAKVVIDLHGGALALASETGTGTVVDIVLPVESAVMHRAA